MICCLRFSLRHSNLCRLSHRYMYIRTYGYINPNLYAHQKQASQRRHIAYLLKQSQIAQLCIMQFAQKLDKHIHTYRCVYSVDFHLSVLSCPKAFPPTFQPSTPSSSPAVFPVCASFSKFLPAIACHLHSFHCPKVCCCCCSCCNELSTIF